jgi:hypothetical protein
MGMFLTGFNNLKQEQGSGLSFVQHHTHTHTLPSPPHTKTNDNLQSRFPLTCGRTGKPGRAKCASLSALLTVYRKVWKQTYSMVSSAGNWDSRYALIRMPCVSKSRYSAQYSGHVVHVTQNLPAYHCVSAIPGWKKSPVPILKNKVKIWYAILHVYENHFARW